MEMTVNRRDRGTLIVNTAVSVITFVVFAMLVVQIVGCHNATEPWNPSLEGTWVGTASSNSETQIITMTVVQDGRNISGEYVSSGGWSGRTSGTLEGHRCDITVTSKRMPLCTIHCSLVYSGNTVSGNYTHANCSATDSGTLTLTKQ